MRLLKHRTRHSPPGTAPGTVTIQPGARKPQLDVTSFGPNAHPASIRRIRLDATESLPELPAGHTVRWLNVAGLGDAEVLQAVGRRFNIHALTLEDIAGTAHRPKAEAYDNYLFIVTQVPIIDKPSPANESDESGMYTAADEPAILATRQISVCIGTDFVITFQEQEDDVIFAPVRQRLMRHAGRLHTLGPDYLAYAILDAALDSFFPLLEDYGEVVERLEADVIEQPSMQQISRIHNLKRNLLTTRRAVWPQREMLNSLIRDETPLIAANTRLYLRDCYDHTIQLLDMIET
ncbi:MAG TPA: magnesium and cobalt transport protein CorA, partial [Salinisphaeraceae bacterium]|nr:magnesium and cobalt transport protein CorA [Salinisphaeraceae bacterium]